MTQPKDIDQAFDDEADLIDFMPQAEGENDLTEDDIANFESLMSLADDEE